jgi:predicted transposase YdaD
LLIVVIDGLREERDEHGHGRREGEQKGKSDKRVTESKARQKEALHSAQTSLIKLRKLQGNAVNAVIASSF